jgi:predicted nucleotidyltransferase
MVNEATKIILEKYLFELRSTGFEVKELILFGSYIIGNYTENSDIDVIVLSPIFDGTNKREDVIKLWKIASKVDTRIEPIPCGVEQWQKDDSNALIEIARREGVSIEAA